MHFYANALAGGLTCYLLLIRESYLEAIVFYRVLEKFVINLNQLHAVSRTQQGRQRGPSVKTQFLSNSRGVAC